MTTTVGTMWCAYFFAILALVALPDALGGGILAIIQWVSQTFIQLVMLSVIMVGQNILGAAADKRADLTYRDAEADGRTGLRGLHGRRSTVATGPRIPGTTRRHPAAPGPGPQAPIRSAR